MRLSLLVAAVGWLGFAGARLIWPEDPSVDIAVLLPVGLTVLWLLHVGTYAVRRTFIARRAVADSAGDRPQRGDARKTIADVASAAGLAIRASFAGSLPDVDASEVLAAFRNALRIEERIKRERGCK